MNPETSPNGNGSSTSSEEWAARIEETREEMDGTIDSINNRIRPHHLAADLIDWSAHRVQDMPMDDVRDAARKAYGPLRTAVDRYPFATACFCVAAGWMGVQVLQQTSSLEKEDGRGRRERPGNLGEPSVGQARTMGDRCKGVARSHPLSVGLGWAVAGFCAAFSLPRTRVEDRWFGAASDRAVGRYRRRLADWMEEGGESLRHAVTEAKGEIKAQELEPSTVDSHATAAVEETVDTLRDQAKENVEMAKQREPRATVREGLKEKRDDYLEQAAEVPQDVADAAQEAAREEGVDPETIREKLKAVGRKARRGFRMSR